MYMPWYAMLKKKLFCKSIFCNSLITYSPEALSTEFIGKVNYKPFENKLLCKSTYYTFYPTFLLAYKYPSAIRGSLLGLYHCVSVV